MATKTIRAPTKELTAKYKDKFVYEKVLKSLKESRRKAYEEHFGKL